MITRRENENIIAIKLIIIFLLNNSAENGKTTNIKKITE